MLRLWHASYEYHNSFHKFIGMGSVNNKANISHSAYFSSQNPKNSLLNNTFTHNYQAKCLNTNICIHTLNLLSLGKKATILQTIYLSSKGGQHISIISGHSFNSFIR